MNIQGTGMFAAAIIWGTWVLVLSGVSLPGFFVTAITSFVGFLVLFAVILARKQKTSFLKTLSNRPLRNYILIVALLEALQNGIYMVAFTLAIGGGGAVFIPVVRALTGIITPLLAIFISKDEKFSFHYLFYGAISTAGAVLIFAWGGMAIDNQMNILAISLASISVVLIGVESIVMKSMAVRMQQAGQTEINTITYQVLFTTLFLLPAIAGYLVINPAVVAPALVPALAFIGFFGLTHVALAFLLRLNALKKITAQQSVIIGYLEYITSMVLAVLFLGEQATLGLVVGAALIIGSSIKAGMKSVE